MLHIPDNARQELIKLVPTALVQEISCFVFYDNHPRDNNTLDIIICNSKGEIKEFYQRELVLSTILHGSNPTDIRILRNSKCELFYLIESEDELFILSRRESILLHKRVTNVDSYNLDDSLCTGQGNLKIFLKDDAVPLYFDDNFENLEDRAMTRKINADESFPIVTQLKRKLTEAKYSVQCNEEAYKKLKHLRQLATFSNYQKTNSKSEDAVFSMDYDYDCMEGATLKVKTQKPWVKVCNKKIVIVLEVLNTNNVSVDNVHILLHGTTNSSIVYTTKLFEKLSTSPFWREKQSQNIKYNCETAVTVVIDLKELKHNNTSKVVFNGVISYKKQGNDYLLPFENVNISTLDTMGEQFDALSNIQMDQQHVILALLATSEKTDFCLTQIKNVDEPDMNVLEILGNHLHMEPVSSAQNVVVHRSSPYHVLHGVMAVCEDDSKRKHSYVSLYTRSPCQVLSFIHYIHDAVPLRIIITTSNQAITSKTIQLAEYNTEITTNTTSNLNYMEYGMSILNQTASILKYFDSCMMKMHESKNPMVQSKIGSEIDMFAGDLASYLEFRRKLFEEASTGIETLKNDIVSPDADSEGMVID